MSNPYSTMPLIVKICGLSTPETLDAALQSGADMVEFVFFPPSPRHIGLQTARDLGQQAKGRAVKVALTVDADDATLADIVETLRPDILQLHRRETMARLRDIKQAFGLPVIKAMAVETPSDLLRWPATLRWPTASCSRPRPEGGYPARRAWRGIRLARAGEPRPRGSIHGLWRPHPRKCRSRG